MHDVVSKRLLFTVWIIVIVTTVVNAALAYVRLGPFNSAVTMLIMTFNAVMIIWYFIGVRRYRPILKIIAVTGFFWMGIFITLTMSDYLTRDWSTTTTRSVNIPVTQSPFEEAPAGSGTEVATAAVPPEPTALPHVTGVPGVSPIGPFPTAPATGQATMPSAQGNQVTIDLSASDATFDKSRIVVPAGSHVVIRFTNHDSVGHNFSVYRTASGQNPIFVGDVIKGPNKTITYRFDAPSKPGTYLFRCDIHPVRMRGSFIVK